MTVPANDKPVTPEPISRRKARAIAKSLSATGGQDRLLRECVTILKAAKREGHTWSWISAQSKDPRSGRPVSTTTINNWVSGRTRCSLTRTMENVLKGVGKKLYIGDK